jgi:hypothetical protein
MSLLRAPVLLDRELKLENETLQADRRAVRNRERPALVVRRCWVDERSFEASPNSFFWSLNILFANGAEGLTEDCIARSVIATMQFFGGVGELLCEVEAGRWGDADQPTDPRASRVPLRRVDFPISETRELNVAIKFSADGRCYAMDNDYVASGGRKQSLEITGEAVTATIRLRAVGIDSRWTVKFENRVAGSLQLLSVEPG